MLSVLRVPHQTLRTKSLPIRAVDEDIFNLMNQMMQIMKNNKGCGLAANQVGILKRILVIDLENFGSFKMANPEIIWESEETIQNLEGCLSIPGQEALITRPKAIKARYLDENNDPKTLETDTFLATCLQHEIDHLNGRLFVDYLSSIKREMLIKKSQKIQ